MLLTSGRRGALSCAMRLGGGLLLAGTDGNPDVVHDHEGAEDNHKGDQASDGPVGHDITSVSSRVNNDRARLSWDRQLDPATGCPAWSRRI
jgi:hypothetical protein